MRNKVKSKKDSGITLVALIITIIILIILAAVTLKALFNDKLVETAIKAGEDYKIAQGQEMNELDKVNNKVTNIINGGSVGGEDPTPPKPPEIVGAISFGDLSWNNGKASVSITKNSEDSYIIEYKVTNKDNVVTREYAEVASGGIITDLSLGDLVTARLTDGTNHSKPADLNVEDGNGPTISASTGTITRYTIQITNVNAVDNEAGMPASITYNYYIKKSIEGTYPNAASYSGTNDSYTFEGKEFNTSYDVKITAIDIAGNIGEKEIKNITTSVNHAPEIAEDGIIVNRTTEAMSIDVTATDADNDNITYTVEYGTSENYGTTLTASGSTGAKKSITLSGVTKTQNIYWKVTASDGIINGSAKTGNSEYCEGGTTTRSECQVCHGLGIKFGTTLSFSETSSSCWRIKLR